jgi:hypothetical protein
MPLLAYCMTEASAAVQMPSAGVAGARVEELQESGLRCCFSHFESREQIAAIPAVESAFAFHQVLQVLFRQTSIISFRFPTMLGNQEELRQHLREHAPRYAEALTRLRHMVQMEIHIGTSQATGTGPPASSGREYLQQRQARAAELKATGERFNQAIRPWVVEWRERQTDGGLRCYVLLHRDAVSSFQQAAQALSQNLPGTRLSGPWPPAEFLEVKDSLNG